MDCLTRARMREYQPESSGCYGGSHCYPRYTSGTYTPTTSGSTGGTGTSTRTSTSTSTSTSLGGGKGGGGGRGTCRYACTIRPPAPPVDQNPHNGSHPVPAVDRPIPKPDWGSSKPGGWQPSDGWNIIVGALEMLGLVDDSQYTPDDAIAADYSMSRMLTTQEDYEFEPAPGSPVRREDCRKGKTAVHYMPLDNLDRAHSVFACLNKGDYNYVHSEKVDGHLGGTGTTGPRRRRQRGDQLRLYGSIWYRRTYRACRGPQVG